MKPLDSSCSKIVLICLAKEYPALLLREAFLLTLLGLFGYWASVFDARAQAERSVFTAVGRGVATTFVTDYQAVGINPANLGFRRSFRDPKFTIGALEGNVTMFSGTLNRRELLQTVFTPQRINLTQQEKQQAAVRFAGSAFGFNFDVMLAGVSIYVKKIGGFAFTINDRVNFFSRLNRTTSEIVFLGGNASYFPFLLLSNGRVVANQPTLSEEVRQRVIAGFIDEPRAQTYGQLLDGSRFSSNWYRELNLAYGTKLIDGYQVSLHAGVGLRLLRGLALINLVAQDGQLIRDQIAMSPTFGLSFGPAQINNPSFVGLQENVSNFRKVLAATPVGTGVAFDAGLQMTIKRNFYLGIAVSNIGSINWTGNAYQLADARLREIQGGGINTYNLLVTSSNNLQLAGERSALEWRGISNIRQQLPGVLRIGASYEYFRTFHIGIDVILPATETASNIEQPIIALGGDYRLNRWIKISTGFNRDGYQTNKINFPAGITYTASRRFFEMGLATRDLITFFAQPPGGSNLAFSVGFARFKW
ncbi:MAG: DUF5723 family protein [Cytophagales bacterium]|nr:DUF5723 family protein [Bernardetiaceae bacterium]MDW8211718.1 DUF5723 family protein [Cytophagales bacterium]